MLWRDKSIEKSKRISTSKNQSYSEKKRGRPNRSETAPSATGIDPRLPPLNKLVRRLLALSSRFLLDFVSLVPVDWHLSRNCKQIKLVQQPERYSITLIVK